MKIEFLYICVLWFTIASPLELLGKADTLDHKQQKRLERQAKKQKKIEEGRWMILPLAGPAYTPELQFLIAGTVMTSFKTNRKDSLIQRSSLPVSIGFSSTGAVTFSAILTSFWKQDKIRVYSDLWLKDMPDNYWGVGYEEARNTPKSDSTTAYQRLWWLFNPRILYQFKKHNFIGINIDYNYTRATDEAPKITDDPAFVEFGSENLNGGFGAIYQYDSRDIPVNAWKGMFFQFMFTYYSKSFGGDNDYSAFNLDFRKYFNIAKRDGSTLAVQLRTRLTDGEVPYGEMSQLGTPFDLRGYTWGRYRHESMLFGIAEYRYMFMKRDETLSPHGFVAWLGTGSVAEGISNFNDWLPNGGFGYRLEVQPRMNLRVDFGFGLDTFGFYFNFNEAF